MHLGIRKIEYIDSTSLHDYSMLPPGSRLDISDFIKSGFGFSELPFTPETGNLEEQWIDDDKTKNMDENERARNLARLVVLNEENVRQILSEVVWL